MHEYELVRDELLSCFLTELSDDTPTSYVEEITRKFLLRKYNQEWVEIFWDNLGETFISELVEEYNRRIADGFPINFEFTDDEGRKVRGWANPVIPFNIANFQKALLSLSDKEFERLATRIIQLVGCKDAWATPTSHDQGLDAFGCFQLLDLPKTPKENNRFTVWILVQAKHYNKEKICSASIREFVGSGYLAKYNIYSTLSSKYEMLELRPLAPIALVIVTSGEVKRTAKLMADEAGIKILTASDICVIFSTQWEMSKIKIPKIVDELACLLRGEAKKVSVTN